MSPAETESNRDEGRTIMTVFDQAVSVQSGERIFPAQTEQPVVENAGGIKDFNPDFYNIR